jgi:lipopolysaccharide biosynthesis protein
MAKVVIRRPARIIRKRPKKMDKKKPLTKDNIINVDVTKCKVGVFLHLFYTDTFDNFCEYLDHSNLNFKLYVNLVKNFSDKKELIEKIKKKYPNTEIIVSSNKGKDVGGKLNLLRHWNTNEDKFDYLIFCHDKKSPHMKNNGGIRWRNQLLNGILSNIGIKTSIKLLDNPEVGMTGSNRWVFSAPATSKGIYGNIRNKTLLENIFKK